MFKLEEMGEQAIQTNIKWSPIAIPNEPQRVEVKIETTKITTQDSYFGAFLSPKTSYIFNPEVLNPGKFPGGFFPEETIIVMPIGISYD